MIQNPIYISYTDCNAFLMVGWLVGWLVGWCMVFNANFNNISVISLWSVLLVGKTGVPGENHRHVASH
jgi:hypothetical protein